MTSARSTCRPRRSTRAKAAGCLPVASAAEAVDGAEAVVTMLPAGKHVDSVYADERVRRSAAPARS